ncbi:MAG: hypothetical protein RL264_1861 [Bacteroidota bacterium]|jgi:class 3 adenylate cyclase/ligand-binding sensor domain-containing protein/HD superfamily phosphodiesterase
MLLFRRFFGIFLLSFVAFHSAAQGSYRFHNFTISNGLSQSFVTCILQDNQSALWIGTQDGLNRYDGNKFEIFNSEDTKGIENSYINCSVKTSDGDLWFGTGSGLLHFDKTNESFTTYLISKKSLFQVTQIAIDEHQNLWLVVPGEGLFYFDPKIKQFEPIKLILPTKKITEIIVLEKEELLLNSEDKGLFLYDVYNRKSVDLNGSLQRTENRIFRIKRINKKVYFASENGIFQFDRKNWKIYPIVNFEGLENYGITDFLNTKNAWYLATASKGLVTIKKTGERFINAEDIFQNNALLNNNLTALYEDKRGKIWIGSERGISNFDPNHTGFKGISPSVELSKGLPSSNVWSISESESKILIGTDVGLTIWDRKTNSFRHFYRTILSQPFDTERNTAVLSICQIAKNEYLLGCVDGLFRLKIKDETTYYFTKISLSDNEQINRKHNRIYRILKIKDALFLIATRSGAIITNLQGKITVFEHKGTNASNSINAGICRVASRDKFGRIWLATSGGGLNQLIEKNGVYSIVRHPISDILIRYSKDYVTAVEAESTDILWLGTFGSGLIRADLNRSRIDAVNKKNGLANNVIYGLLRDKKGWIWISTNRGISAFDFKSKSVQNFSSLNGLLSDEFNLNAYFKSSNGEFYFGGIEGLNFFYPQDLQVNSGRLKVILSGLIIDKNHITPSSNLMQLKKPISKTQQLELDYKHRSFSLTFHTDDISNPELISYRYQLYGDEVVDKIIGNTNEIAFNSLSSGDYQLKIYARIGNGKWCKPTILNFKIFPPFWNTWWFYLIVLAVVILIAYLAVRARIDAARREQVRLEIKIAQRTREIRQQKNQIEEQSKLLEEEKNKVVEQQKLLQVEKDKAERWLNNTLPSEAVIELKRAGKVQAQSFKTVTVMFTDVVGFSQISERTTPNRLVTKLDVLFQKFDDIISSNRLEKIKTIGDAYMCAGGVPTKNSTNPIDACIAALQIQDHLSKLKFDAIANHKEYWEIRIGINTGPVTAGIIGNLRLAYDIWGSTVNIAQQMEMHGEPGKVTVSKNTFDLVEPYFEFEPRGKVLTKGKTTVEMFTILRIKPELSVHGEGLIPNARFEEIVKLHHFSSIKYYKTEHYVLNILNKKLSPDLIYHSIHHTKDVVKAVERIALLEGVTDEGLFLLKTAAILHDAGFIEQYEHNEPIGARMAKEILPKYGYTEQHINTIVDLIHVTSIPHRPINKLQEIICDADLDYLGREDFEEIADRLRVELRKMGKINSDRVWDEMQVEFLKMHQYFTKTAIESRQKMKMEHLKVVEERLRIGNYKD